MRCVPISLAILLFWLGAAGPAQAEVAVQDDSGQWVRLAQPARRIVSLAPHLTENLFAAGAGEHLVGTVARSDYPPAARTLPQVGTYPRVDLEALLALKPDLVLAWQSGNAPVQIEKLRALGVPLYISQPDRIEDIAREVERLGTLAGTSAQAGTVAAQMRTRLADLRARFGHRGEAPVRTFYQVWHQPIVTVAGTQIIGAAIRLCGGENVFATLPQLAPHVTVEAVVTANPEAIVVSGQDEQRPAWLDDWRRWPSITAVARGNLFFVPARQIQRHTPQFFDGVEALCRQLETARRRR